MEQGAVLLFDGLCNLCNASVDFVITRDKRKVFKYASLQSAEGMALRAGDIQLDPQKFKLLTDPQRVLSHVVALRVEEEKPAEAEGEKQPQPEEAKA